MLKITAFKYMPHNLKEIFWYSYDEIDKAGTPKNTNETVTGDIAFNQDVLADKITATMKQNAYRVYYFKGVHPPYDMSRDVEPAKYEGDNYVVNYVENIQEDEMLEEQAFGCIRIITNFIEALKEKGLYDQTTIIIPADHGWENRYNPMLLIKPANSTGPYQVSHAPVSYIEDFAPTVLSIIGDKYTTQKTVFDYSEDEIRTRFFYVYDGINTLDRSYTKLEIYSTTGFANDKSEYQLKQVLSNAKPYTIGAPIIFTNEDNGTVYFELGTSVVETDYVWSVGKEGKMVIPLEDNPTDLLAQFTFKAVYNGKQSVIVKSNGSVLFDGVVSSSNATITFEIPASCIQDQKLILDLYYPDAVSPASLNRSTDSRMLAVAYSKIVFSKMPDKENEINDEPFHEANANSSF